MIAECGVALVSRIHLVARPLAVAILVSIADMGLFLAFVFLPESSLVLRIEVYHVERVLEINEEVTRILRCVIFGSSKINACISVSVRLIDFLFELLLVILDGQVLYTKICTEIFSPLDPFNITGIFVLRERIAE